MKTLNYKTANVMRSIVVSLIILASFSTVSKGENSTSKAIESEPVLSVESWMNSNSYWNGNRGVEEPELTLNIESWMNNRTYWEGTNESEASESLSALAIENWMTSDNYWVGRTNVDEQELTLEIESWMNNSIYWTGSENQITSGSELANN